MIGQHFLASMNVLTAAFQDIKFHQSWKQKPSFRDNVLGRKFVGKNGFIVESISTDSVL